MTKQARMTTWMAAGAIAALFVSAARADDVRMWPTATVDREVITVGDVAELSGVIAERERLSETVVHAAPLPGAELRIGVADVREALAERNADLAAINFIGASACRVSRARAPEPPKPVIVREKRAPSSTRRVKHTPHKTNRTPDPGNKQIEEQPVVETVEAALRQYIEAHAAMQGGKLEIRFGSAQRDVLRLPLSECRVDIQPDNPDDVEGWLGMRTFRVDVTRADQKTTPVAIIAEIAMIRPVVVAKRPINLGQKIEAAALRVESRRFDDVRKMGITDMRAAIGQTAAQFIDVNAMVMPKALAAAPVVKRGETVTIWRRGGVQIRLTGKAQADGMLGSTIKVRRNGSKNARELLDAVVTGPGTVELSDAIQVAGK